MKKSNFVALVFGVISLVFFGLGMVLVLVPEFAATNQGTILGVCGLVLALIGVIVWRKLENKSPVKINGKTIGYLLVGIIGALGLGLGMCMTMVWGMMIQGTLVGLVGILVLLALIPLVKGIK
ncbi:MAG: hypothetical protein ACK5LZ_02270 [Anaerorhabdus sp.]